MAAIDDLTAAITSLQAEGTAVQTAVGNLVAEVTNLQTAVGAGDTAAIEAAVASITTVANDLSTIAASDPGSQAG